MPDRESVFLACPTHDGRVSAETAVGLYAAASRTRDCGICVRTSSLLTMACNELWMMAIAQGKHQWFAMLHSDIGPEQYWLDKLIGLAIAHDADMVSAIVPIKNNSGVTSTAIGTPDDGWGFERRLTQREIHDKDFPDVFEHPRLLLNTGCCVVRMRPEIANPLAVYFDSPNAVTQEPDGTWFVRVVSEDWFFSRAIRQAGGKVLATKAVRVNHHGHHIFPSDAVWGDEHDLQAVAENRVRPQEPTTDGPPAPRIQGVKKPKLAEVA